MKRKFVLLSLVLLGVCTFCKAQLIITTIAGNGSYGYGGDGGPAKLATLGSGDLSVAVDVYSNVYIDDMNNNRVREVNNSGIIYTYAGNGMAFGLAGDGGPATNAVISNSYGVATDAAGNVYITDGDHNRIRKVDHATGIITTIAGNGLGGYTGDGGPATNAQINVAFSVFADNAGNVYFSNLNTVRKINTSGIISTIAGNPSSSGFGGDNGPATLALFDEIEGIAVDGSGNVFVADLENNRVRKINTSGIVTTIAGTGYGSYGGDGGPATSAWLWKPYGIALDQAGNIYVGEINNVRVRRISVTDTITTIAGSGTPGFSGDGGPATAADLNYIQAIAIDAAGSIYICDGGTRVRKIFKNHAPYFKNGLSQSITVCENSRADSINSQLAAVDSDQGQTLYWSTLTGPAHGTVISACNKPTTGGLVTPVGLSYTPGAGYSGPDSFKIRVTDSCAWDTITIYVTINPISAISGATALCTGNTYLLSDAPTSGTWLSSNTTAATIGPGTGLVNAVATGTSTITYTTTLGCTAVTTVTVNPAALPITGVTSVCAGATTALTDAGGGTWSSSNTLVASVISTGVVTGVLAGTATITYQLPTGCSVTTKVTVATAPAGITGTTHVCAGNNTALSDATTGGSWSSSNTAIATVGSVSGIVSGIALGTVTITYGIGTGCETLTTFTVTTGPAAITGTPTACRGNNTTLSDGVSGGIWTSSNTIVATIGSSGTVTGASAGTSSITYSLGAGCIATLTVTVNPLSPVTGGTSVCVGATLPLSDSVSGGLWTSSNTTIATIGSGSGIVTGGTLGSTSIVYTLPTGCTASTTVTVSISPTTIIGPSAVCTGSSVSLSDVVGGGTWIASNTTVSVGFSTGMITGNTPGSATITYSLGSGCTITKSLTVYAVPLPVTGASAVCVGGTTVLTDATGGGAWSSGNTSIGTISSGGLLTGTGAGNTIISYTLASGCAALKTFTVNPTPTVITGSKTVCVGTVITLSDGISGGNWTSSNTAKATVNVSSGDVTGVAAGNATITYSPGAGCIATYPMTVNPVSPITGSTNLCELASSLLADAITGGAWSSSNTSVATISSGGILAGVAAGTSILTYTMLTGCMVTTTATVNPLPGPINGITAICKGTITTLSDGGTGVWSSPAYSGIVSLGSGTGIVTGISAGTAKITYSFGTGCAVTTTMTINPIAGAISGASGVCVGSTTLWTDGSGTWSSVDAPVSVAIGSGIITGVSAGTANITYTPLTGCSTNKTITVNPLPAAITGSGNICIGTATTLSDGGSGTWSSSGSSLSVGVTTGIVNGIIMGTGTVTYELSTGCSTMTILTINPSPAKITGASSICASQTTPLSDSTAGGAWSSPGYTGIVSVNPATGIVTGLAGGVAVISYTSSTGCMTAKSITVNPAVPPIINVTDMCANTMKYVYDIDTPYGSWTSTFVTITTAGLVTASNPGVGIITYTLPTHCFTTATLTVDPLPDKITGPGAVCNSLSISLSDTTSGGIWTSGNTAIAIADASSGIITGVSAGLVGISYSLPTGCFLIDTITVDPIPSPISGTSNLCVGTTKILSDTLPGGVWVCPSGIVSVGGGTGDLTGIVAGTAVISYTSGKGCMVTKTVTIMPLPAMYAVSGGGAYCAGGAGYHIFLGGSSTGVMYKLLNGGIALDSISGTGILLDYGPRTAAGVYEITASDNATGCTVNMSDSAIIVVNPLTKPSVSISDGVGDTVCSATQVTFTALPLNAGSSPSYQWILNGSSVGSGSDTYSFTPADGDVIIVMMTSSAVCATPALTDTFALLSVIKPIAPVVIITADPGTNIAKGQSVVFTAAVTNGVPVSMYQWLLNGTLLPGETNATYTTGSLANYDSVSCMVTGSTGQCTAGSEQGVVMNVNNVSIKNSTAASIKISVLPNPNKCEFTVEGSLGTMDNEEVSLEITDILGQTVYKDKVIAVNGTISKQIRLNNTLANGTYFLNVGSGALNKVFNVVVAH